MNRFKVLAVLLSLGYILSSFSGAKVPAWIPKDFDPRKNILLVQSIDIHGCMEQGDDKQKRVVKEGMADYPYKYELADPEDITSGKKYQNKDVYRWALLTSRVDMGDAPGQGTMRVSGADFHIYDRKMDKHYAPTGRSNSFLKAVLKYTISNIVKYVKGL